MDTGNTGHKTNNTKTKRQHKKLNRLATRTSPQTN